jgi:TolB-like protein
MKYTRITALILTLIILSIACGSKPEVYTQKKISFKPYKTLAILPFSNYSGKEDAGKQVSNAFLVELLKKPFFKILEPGQVDKVLRDERIRSADQIDIQTAQLLKDKLAVDYILIGAVNEFDYLKNGERDIPLIGFSARLLDTSTGQIIWAAYHSRKGDDRELIFNWGLITSLTKLAEISVKDVTDRFKIEQ